MPNIAAYQTTEAGTPDLINYAALVAPGTVLCKDGSLLAGYTFRGDDAGSSSDADKNYLTALVNNHLFRFTSGWSIWIDAIRTPSPGYPDPSRSHFPDAISAMIDAERREMFESMDTLFETDHVIVFQYKPPSKTASKAMSLFYTDKKGVSKETDYIKTTLLDFNAKLKGMEEGLKNPLHLRRMATVTVGTGEPQYESDELANYLHYRLTGSELKLRVPSCPMYMDSWLGYEPFWSGSVPKIGKKYIACVAITGFPAWSTPGILSLLEELPLEYTWSTRFIFESQQGAMVALDRYYRKWRQWAKGSIVSQMRRDGGSEPDLDAQSMSDEVIHAKKDARSGAVAHGYYTPVVVMMDEDPAILELKASYVKTAIENLGFHARREEANTEEAWFGSLPGHPHPNVRRPFTHTLNLSDLMPLSSIWPGLKSNPCSLYPENSPPLLHATTTGSTPFRLNLHVGDVGHTIVFGPTGAGKSTLLAMIALQFLRYRGKPQKDGTTLPATVTVFDKGYSMYAAASAVGGAHYDIGADDSELRLCPLAEIDTVSGRIWAKEWLGICFELQTQKKLSPSQKKRVHEALERMSKEAKENRRMSEFVLSVQDQEVHDALMHYTGGLLDGVHDAMTDSHFTVYEIGNLMSLGPENALPVFLHLSRRVERSLKGQPAMLLLDEVWVLLGNEVMREKLKMWLKEFRKLNCMVILATQSLSDATRSGILDVLIEQCPTKIFLPNIEADSFGTPEKPGPADLYTMFGLGKAAIELLKSLQYMKHYYVRSPLGRRVVDMELGPLALSFVGVGIDEMPNVKTYEAQYGRDWPLYWMKDRGIDYEKYTVQK